MLQRDTPSILVIGAGSIGLRHLRNLRDLGMRHLAACDVAPDHLAAAASEIDLETFNDIDEALSLFRPDAVFVCTPPVYHVPNALKAIRANAHVFIEKPLSVGPAGIANLVEEATRRRRVAMVGYNLRFHPGLLRIKQLLDDGELGRLLWVDAEFGQYLPDWRPGTDYRKAYTARRELGGGILLDLSHEIDYLMWLCGDVEQVNCFAGHLSTLDVDVEDTAKMLVSFTCGAVGHVHLDFVQQGYTRRCKVVGDQGTVELDLADSVLRVLKPGQTNSVVSNLHYKIQETYFDEVRHFLGLIESGEGDVTSLTASRSTLDVVLAAYQSAGIDRGQPERSQSGLVKGLVPNAEHELVEVR
jgi:predicted dehydrogenase